MKKITLKEMAAMLSLSPSTVSRAMANHPDISDETKSKVNELKNLYNYSPNLGARSLRTKQSGLIALILPEYNMFFIPILMQAISNELSENNYSLLVFQSDNSYIKELEIIAYCNQLAVDGILMSIGNGFNQEAKLLKLNEEGAPIVLLDKVWKNESISSIGIDGKLIAENAVTYLMQKGHSEIGGVFFLPSHLITEQRLSGFKKLISDSSKSLIVHDLEHFESEFNEFIALNPSLTALFVMTDELLLRVHKYLHNVGKHIPSDISLIAISDGVIPKFLTPAITHIFHSPLEVGKAAVKVILEQVKKTDAKPKNLNIDCPLIELGSVKDLNS